MSNRNRQPQWDIYEAALLLEGYLELLQGKSTQARIVKQLSANLRQMAINRGIKIDSIFRNENGISYQIKSMDSAYKGETVYVPATKLFNAVVTLYRSEPQRYYDILAEARNMASEHKKTKDAFLAWAKASFPAQRYKWLRKNLLNIEQFAVASKLISGSIFEVTELTTLETILRIAEKNQLFRFKNRKHIDSIFEDYKNYIQFCTQKPNARNFAAPETTGTNTLERAADSKRAATSNASASSASEREYYDYLQNTSNLASTTCAAYVSAIRSAERYAIDNGYDSSILFCEDKAVVVATVSELYGDPDFVRYNEQQHNRFTAAINKLLESIDAEVPKKVPASTSVEREPNIVPAEASSGIALVLKQHFEYGFKYGSIREVMRFRQFAEEMSIELPEDDETLKTAILASGVIIEDKLFCKNDNLSQDLCAIVDDAFSSGARVLYYESLYEKKQKWMEAHIITSPDALKEYLQKSVSECSFSKKFFVRGSRQTEREIVTSELKRVWGDKPSESVYELRNRLPYIPLGNIWRVISGNDLFVLVSEGEYLILDRFCISEEDKQTILDYVKIACDEKGFASLSDVPLGSIEEENFEVPRFAIYNAVFKKVLSGKYHLNGKIITKGITDLDTITLLKKYIREKDECSFDEVADMVVELTGDTNRQYAFQALYDEKVRVDKNRFVANKFVKFNIDEIDAILSDFVTEEFRAIRDITTFAMFPICGQNWNHYLLESFCYKYSRKYSLHVMNFNDKNAGIIAEKTYSKPYNEMLSIALARTDVELTSDVIGQYLFNTGYMAKSKYAKLGEIAQRASELRKER